MAAIISLLLLAAPRLRADGPATMDRNYLVELHEAATAVDDPTAVATELAKTYGGHPAISDPGRGRGFVIAMSAEEARLLASDPRVKAVHETTAASAQSRHITANDVLAPITVGPYKYDGAGNIVHMGTDRYTYDEMSRITSGTAVTAQNTETQQFDYDGFGNLKKVTVPNKSTVYVDSDPATNRLRDTYGSETGSNVLHFWGGGYDAAGNQQSWNGTPSYVYDSMNMLSEMTYPRHEFYLYDANDERVATVSYTNAQIATWRYTLRDEGNHVLRTVTDTILSGAHSWQQTEDYVYRPGGLLAAITPQGTTETRKHFHLDHLGSAVLITDDNGQRVSSHKYWPFGGEAPGGDTDNERMKFTGHERDLAPFDPNGLDYMHARYYSSITGHFLSVDPVMGDQRTPQSWNRYSYVRNNPLGHTDPTGRESIPGELDGLSGSNVVPNLKSLTHYDDIKEAFVGFGSAPLNEKLMAVGVIGISVLDIGSNFLEPEEGAVENATVRASEELLHHWGTEKKTVETLARKSAQAEVNLAEHVHGVSVTTAVPNKPHTSALRAQVEKHFPVKKTGADPHHFTVELPKPITQQAVDLFNRLFSRK